MGLGACAWTPATTGAITTAATMIEVGIVIVASGAGAKAVVGGGGCRTIIVKKEDQFGRRVTKRIERCD